MQLIPSNCILKNYTATLLAAFILILVTGCAPGEGGAGDPSASSGGSRGAGEQSPRHPVPWFTQSPSPVTPVTPSPSQTVTVTIYKPDPLCQELIPEPVAVSVEDPIEAAVGKVLEARNSADFTVAGYRIDIDPSTGVATVDMRLTPGSQRRFVSMSSCEQFALFGSLRRTLTENRQWGINEVRFTDRGEEIIL
ncbi:sporulation/spore germination protein [[Phormidium] sp. ETS-05]|uniref:sporulation/spore germination protein n=1 Tax=[Phormidium] sp. ETS-05 TaxID=222819 RepID=UPI0018EF1F59|nr:sporulation/spore germination protein [[Phormidium] sp. ETS-05]